MGHNHTVICVIQCLFEINQAHLGHSIPLFHGLQYDVNLVHHAQRGRACRQTAKQLVIKEVPYVCHGETRHVVLRLPEGVCECHWSQQFQAGDTGHFRQCCQRCPQSCKTGSGLKAFVVSDFQRVTQLRKFHYQSQRNSAWRNNSTCFFMFLKSLYMSNVEQ